jgi:hypothetical protein
MAQDAGTIVLTMPASGGATEAANAIALSSTGDKGFVVCPLNLNLFEVGLVEVVAASGTAIVVTFAVAPAPGGAYTTFATITSPTAAVAAGVVTRKYVDVRVNKGDVIRVNVGIAAAAGTALAYVKAYPAGEGAAEPGDVTSTT